jgi:two-component system OmpR family response regulator
MRVLLIEDDSETADYIVTGLCQGGPHTVEVEGDGASGLVRAIEGGFDILIVDRMIPQLDGLSVVRGLRGAGVRAPILFLTALGAVEERVAGLMGGADDYLVKPFSFAELQARVNALARRLPMHQDETILTVGDLTLDRLQRVVRRGDRTIDLQPREFQLLEALMLNAGRILTRSMLLAWVWRIRFDPGTNIVEAHISRIRTKIDRGGDPALIHTIRGEGYVVRVE